MNKGMIISYFDKGSKTRYVSSSMTQLAIKLGVHRNTIANWLKTKGFYEDDTCLVFSINNQEFIHRLRKKKSPKNPIDTFRDKRKDNSEIVQPVRIIEQPTQTRCLWDLIKQKET